ncbi:hypothetical protein C8Q80DRAFT_1275640 [Daedaleopsis nitida]|nr:hypothetical protein C8Q80DRAFT_1275640 [Daedaleopsis nitida]
MYLRAVQAEHDIATAIDSPSLASLQSSHLPWVLDLPDDAIDSDLGRLRPSTGKVVPTQDYTAMQVYGRVKVFFDAHDPERDAFLSCALPDLRRFSETGVMLGDSTCRGGWRTCPRATYVALLKKAIVGVEVEITNMGGKCKMSQELGEGDRRVSWTRRREEEKEEGK